MEDIKQLNESKCKSLKKVKDSEEIVPEWKETAIFMTRIKKISRAIVPLRSEQINLVDDEIMEKHLEDLKEIVEANSSIKVKNSLFQLLVDFSGALYKRGYVLSENDYFKKLLSLLGTKVNTQYFSEKQATIIKSWMNNDFVYFQNKSIADKKPAKTEEGQYPRRLQLAETVLQRRTTKFAIVIDCYDGKPISNANHIEEWDLTDVSAALRTADCLGVQLIYIVLNQNLPEKELYEFKQSCRSKITRGTQSYLNLQIVSSVKECCTILESESRNIWVAHPIQELIPKDITSENILNLNDVRVLPSKLAIIIPINNTCNTLFHEHASKHVYLPVYGFTPSLSFSIFSALIMQQIFIISPETRGEISEEEKKEIRAKWYSQLTRKHLEKSIEELDRYLKSPPPVLEDLRDPGLFSTTRGQQWAAKKIMQRDLYTQQLENNDMT